MCKQGVLGHLVLWLLKIASCDTKMSLMVQSVLKIIGYDRLPEGMAFIWHSRWSFCSAEWQREQVAFLAVLQTPVIWYHLMSKLPSYLEWVCSRVPTWNCWESRLRYHSEHHNQLGFDISFGNTVLYLFFSNRQHEHRIAVPLPPSLTRQNGMLHRW